MKSTKEFKKMTLIALFSILFVLTIGASPVFAANGPCASATALSIGNSPMFPIIPTIINESSGCNPPFWTIDIISGLVFKLIRLLNWFGISLATLAVVYSGFMYILGFANEENVKKSKNIMKAALTGLVIIVCAKWIVYGTILMFSNSKSGGTNAQIQLFLP